MKKIIEVLILIGGLMMVVSCVNPSSVSDDNETQNTNNTEVQNGGDNEIVATPIISLNNSIVTISCATNGATIHYTTDGSTPTVNSPTYTNAITLTTTTTIKAIAVKEGMDNSSVATQNVVIQNGGGNETQNMIELTNITNDNNNNNVSINGLSNSNINYPLTFTLNGVNYSFDYIKINNNIVDFNSLDFDNSNVDKVIIYGISNVSHIYISYTNSTSNATLIIQTN